MKVVIVGGSAPSTPHLLVDSRLAGDSDIHFTLHARSSERLALVRDASVALAPALRNRVDVDCDLARALTDADAVIVQLRVGGLAARARDEAFPLLVGVPGDEGLGPGGLAAAWRSWPALREVLANVAISCPKAAVALMTAPLGILVRCAREAFSQLDVAGICELPGVVLERIRNALGDPADLSYDYAGVNHLGWFTRIQVRGTDSLDAYAETQAGVPFPAPEDIRAAGAVPLPYVELDAHPARVVAAQRSRRSRAEALSEIASSSFDAFESGDPSRIAAALAQRPAPWYPRAVAPWIFALRTDADDVDFFLTTRNGAYLTSERADAVVEIPHRRSNGSFVAAKSPAPPSPQLAARIAALVAYERRAAECVGARSAADLPAVLATHPWIPPGAARQLVAGVLDRAAATEPT